MTEPTHVENLVRTDMNCTNCSKNFVAQLDFALDGNYVVECPWCGHHHCRTIENGKVTETRWQSRNGNLPTINVDSRSVWKSDSQPIQTSSASYFIRQQWMNRSDLQL